MNAELEAAIRNLAADVKDAIQNSTESFQAIANRFQVSNSYVYERSVELRNETGFQRRPKKAI
jgi:hypothetical protein